MKLALIFAVAALRASFAGAQEPQGSCVSCHRQTAQTGSMSHNFTDWENSIHGKSGIECQACHGGDASSPKKEAAHKGMLPAKDPKSKIYFTKIPDTCGSCHASEYSAFQQSSHFRELERSGKGPNCVTCHGSMADHVISPKDMEMTCTLCHRQPTQAFAARQAMESARADLRRLDKDIRQNKAAAAGDTSAAEKTYAKLVDRLQEAVVAWHTFKTDKVKTLAADISRDASAAFTELKIRRRKP